MVFGVKNYTFARMYLRISSLGMLLTIVQVIIHFTIDPTFYKNLLYQFIKQKTIHLELIKKLLC